MILRRSAALLSVVAALALSIDDLATGLRSGTIDPSDVPAIRVFQRNGQSFSLDIVSAEEAGMTYKE